MGENDFWNEMDEENENFPKLEDCLRDMPGVPIPKRLYSAYLDGPFTKCIDCEKEILVPSCFYEIEKVFKGTEPIFEYAICSKCGENLLKQYSKESKKALQKYFLDHFIPYPIRKLNGWPEECCDLCGKSKEKGLFEEYTAMGVCRGNEMLTSMFICHSCVEGMEKVLSEKTRRTIQEFIENKFPGVPAEFSPIPILSI